jgi:hypothetical protein
MKNQILSFLMIIILVSLTNIVDLTFFDTSISLEDRFKYSFIVLNCFIIILMTINGIRILIAAKNAEERGKEPVNVISFIHKRMLFLVIIVALQQVTMYLIANYVTLN